MKKTKFDVGRFLKQNNALLAYLRDKDGIVVGALMGIKNKAGDDVEISKISFVDSEFNFSDEFIEACGFVAKGTINIQNYNKVGDWPLFYESLSELVPEENLEKLKYVKMPQYFCDAGISYNGYGASIHMDFNFYKAYRKEIVTYLRRKVNSERDFYYDPNHRFVPAHIRQQIRAFEYRCWKYFKII